MRPRSWIALVMIVPFLMFGCAAAVQEQAKVQADVQADVTHALTALQNVGVPDLQAAAADATAHNDPEAAMCWNGLVPIVQSMGTNGALPTVPKIIGGATLFQAVRDVIKGGAGASAGTPIIVRQINMACGPLYVSARADVRQVLAMVGLAAAGGPGAAGAAGSIPAVLQPVVNQILQNAIVPAR